MMKEAEAFSTTVWLADVPQNQPAQQQSTPSPQQNNGGNNGGRNNQNGGTRGNQNGGAKPLQSSSGALKKIQDRTTAVQRYGSQFKTAKMDSQKKQFCKPWNDHRNQVGCTINRCNNRHACDVLLPSGKPCEGDHRRVNHSGPTVPFS